MRYVQVPGEVTILHPFTLEPWEVKNPVTGAMEPDKPISFAKACRMAVQTALDADTDKKISSMFVLDLLDKINHCTVGGWLQLTDDEFKFLDTVFNTAKLWTATYLVNAGVHIRAFADARGQLPAALKPVPAVMEDPGDPSSNSKN